jgi:hypothetical protein
VSQRSLRLHSKLYRARAIDRALDLARAEAVDATLSRTRDGSHQVVTVDGLDDAEAVEMLAEIADAALVITAELDGRPGR